jgi:CheY-like chemotaxis protein
MKLLEYKIAWIDDQPDKAQGYKSRLESLLGRYGLELSVQWASTAEALQEFLKSLNENVEYDMIMVDWKLGQVLKEGNGGATVASEIRARHSLAMIVFYSAENPRTLRSQIAEKLIDGVYCVNRTHFIEEATPLVKSSLKRFSDFNGMRGLFLAAVAEFDEVIRSATFKAYNGLPGRYQQQVINQLLDGRFHFASKQAADAHDHERPSDLATVIQSIRPSTWELYTCLKTILEFATPSPQHTQACDVLKRYEEEIITPRNDMAHLREILRNGEKVLVRGNREWDSTKFDGLRQALSDHHNNLTYIKSRLIDDLIEAISQDETAIS